MPSDLTQLGKLRESRSFPQWDGFIAAPLISQSETAITELIDRLIGLGRDPSREQVQNEVDVCIRQFNELDITEADSWICTIEREDISEVLWTLIDTCGYEGDEDWLGERDW